MTLPSKHLHRSAKIALVAAFCFLGSGLEATDNERTWTNLEGKQIRASYVELKSDKVVLKLSDGSTALVHINQLSEVDRNFIKSSNFSASATDANRPWPSTVEVSSRAIEVKLESEDPPQLAYIYRSEYFQFFSQDKLSLSLIKEIARTFELTRALVSQLPWSITPRPPSDLGFYQAKFYLTRQNYERDGAPSNSAGVYSTGDRTFKVPFSTLGLKLRGKSWYKDESFDNGTIIHELTHQMMHDSIPFLTPWLIEGTAEYTEMLPRSNGKIFGASHEKGIRDYIKDSVEQGFKLDDILPPSNLMLHTMETWSATSNISLAEQHRRYLSACLLVYYFNHLDPSNGKNFHAFMGHIHKAQQAWEQFFNHPKVQRLEDGSYEYPSNLPLPTFERSGRTSMDAYSILLDKRSMAELDQDFKQALSKLSFR